MTLNQREAQDTRVLQHLLHQALEGSSGDHPLGRLQIDLDALAQNFRRLRSLASPAECGAVVKADGYGLGATEIVRRLVVEGCRSFFVAQLDEAILLRQAKIDGLHNARIFVLSGLGDASPDVFCAYDLCPVLSTMEDIERCTESARRLGFPVSVGLQFDTGMNRMGLRAAEMPFLTADWLAENGLRLDLLMSHLACADEPGHALNQEQALAFRQVARSFPGITLSLANSGGVLLGPAFHHDLVRPGIALYGGNPRANSDNLFQPVVTAEARVLQTFTLKPGDTVGYGATFRAEQAMRVATVGAGYGDGYPRSLGGNCAVGFKGERLPILGRVSMDLLTVDISHLPEDLIGTGSWVELFGKHIPIDTIASAAGTIGYEILTMLGHRYARRYKGALASTGNTDADHRNGDQT